MRGIRPPSHVKKPFKENSTNISRQSLAISRRVASQKRLRRGEAEAACMPCAPLDHPIDGGTAARPINEHSQSSPDSSRWPYAGLIPNEAGPSSSGTMTLQVPGSHSLTREFLAGSSRIAQITSLDFKRITLKRRL